MNANALLKLKKVSIHNRIQRNKSKKSCIKNTIIKDDMNALYKVSKDLISYI